MTTLTFENEHHYSGDKTIVQVRLLPARLDTRVEMVLDSGAEISILNREFIAPLGLDVESGESVEIVVANKQVTRAYIHPIGIEFLGRGLTIPAAICPGWDTQNLLGMRGFVDQMVVAFDHANRTIYF